jgi:hypothetical protein
MILVAADRLHHLGHRRNHRGRFVERHPVPAITRDDMPPPRRSTGKCFVQLPAAMGRPRRRNHCDGHAHAGRDFCLLYFARARPDAVDLASERFEELRLRPQPPQRSPGLWRKLPDGRENLFVGAVQPAAADEPDDGAGRSERSETNERCDDTRDAALRRARAVSAETCAARNLPAFVFARIQPLLGIGRIDQYDAGNVAVMARGKDPYDKRTKRMADEHVGRLYTRCMKHVMQLTCDTTGGARQRSRLAPTETRTVVCARCGDAADSRLHVAPAQ